MKTVMNQRVRVMNTKFYFIALTLLFLGLCGCSDEGTNQDADTGCYSGKFLFFWDSMGVTVIQVESVPGGISFAAIRKGVAIAVDSFNKVPAGKYIVGDVIDFQILSYKEETDQKYIVNNNFPKYTCDIALCK